MVLPGVVASSHHVAANGAVAIGSSSDRFSRTATGLATNFSITCWAKLAVDRNTYSMIIGQDNGGGNYYQIGPVSNGTTLSRDGTSGASANTGYDMVVGTWVFIGSVNDTGAGTDIFGWKPAGGSWSTVALSAGITVTGPADANTFYIGKNGFGDWFQGSIAAVKVWSAVLTDAELQAEAATYAPVKTSGLWASYSFASGPQTTDDSGNGRTLTQAGAPTLDSSGPPIT